MKPLGYLGPVSEEWIKENRVVGCPHPHITSDHFSLLAELAMSPATSSSGADNKMNSSKVGGASGMNSKDLSKARRTP